MTVTENEAMEFWTDTAGADTASVADAGKKESFMRQWRATTFWDVTRLDGAGHAAVKAAYLHVCAVLAIAGQPYSWGQSGRFRSD